MKTFLHTAVRTARWRRFLALASLLASGTCVPALAQQHAHTHGRLAMDVAVDAQSITIGMEVPLDNFVGFERAPRTEAERKRVADMVARLNAADRLFVPDPAAECRLAKVTLRSGALGLGEPAKAEPVAAPGKAGKEAKGAKEAEEHADIDVSVEFTCPRASQARFVDVKLFEAFPRVKHIDGQVATVQGQFKRSLTAGKPRLAWGG